MPDSAAERQQKLVNELRVSANLMTLDAGLFCIVCTPSRAGNAQTGLPGVRISLPPGAASRPEAVTISTFRNDGWLGPFGDAALVRVAGSPAHVLVTVYQAPDAPDGGAPNIQVLRLADAASLAAAPAFAEGAAPRVMDMVAHIQGLGDVGGMLGDHLGEAGSGRWIEGFAIAPTAGVDVADIEYQGVLGRDWLSPWVAGGQFCGSRGMALPLLGFRLRLRGAAAQAFECRYSATFVDGSTAGPVTAGEACQSEGLAALESVLITLAPRGSATVTPPAVKASPPKASSQKAPPQKAPPQKAPPQKAVRQKAEPKKPDPKQPNPKKRTRGPAKSK